MEQPGGLTKPPLLKRIVDVILNVGKKIWKIFSFIAGIIILLLLLLNHRRYTILPMEVSSEISNTGNYGNVISTDIGLEIDSLINTSLSYKEHKSKEFVADYRPELDVDIKVLGVGFGLDGLIRNIKFFFGVEDKYIRGNFISNGSDVVFILHIGNVVKVFSEKKNPIFIRETLNHLEKEAAIEILRVTNPVTLAGYFFNIEEYHTSQEILDNVLKTPKNDMQIREAKFLHAMLLTERGYYYESTNEFRTILQAEPKDSQILYGIAVNFYDSKQYDSARYYYRRLLKINPHYVLAIYDLAFLIRIDSSKILFNKYIQDFPNDAFAYGNYAVYLEQISDFKQADLQYKKALSLSESVPILLNYAMFLKNRGKLREADLEISKIFKIDSHNSLSYQLRAQIASRLYKISLAKYNYLKSIELSDNNYDLKIEYATYLKTIGETNEAFHWFGTITNSLKIMVSTNIRDWHHWEELGNVYYQEEDSKNALIAYDSAINIYPNDFYAIINKSMCLGTKYKIALNVIDAALEIDSQNSAAYLNRSVLLSQMGNFPQAVKEAKYAIVKDSYNLQSWIQLADLYWRNYQDNMAIECLRTASKVLPEISNLPTILGIYEVNNGQFSYALKEFNRSKVLTPDSQDGWLNCATVYATYLEDISDPNAEEYLMLLIENYKNAFKIKRPLPDQVYILTWLKLDDEIKETISNLKEGTKLNADLPGPYLNLCFCQIFMRQFRESLESINMAMQHGMSTDSIKKVADILKGIVQDQKNFNGDHYYKYLYSDNENAMIKNGNKILSHLQQLLTPFLAPEIKHFFDLNVYSDFKNQYNYTKSYNSLRN